MATPRRRSSRLHSQTPQRDTVLPKSPTKLSALFESDETPKARLQSLNAVFSSPSMRRSNAIQSSPGLQAQTPQTANRIRPESIEMHPAHFQSTVKKLAAQKRPSGSDGGITLNTSTPTKHSLEVANLTTPSKTDGKNVAIAAPPKFDFHFNRPSTDLSDEAKRLMEEVREKANKIKGELAAQREMQSKNDGASKDLFGRNVRRIAQPKGKIGRFSDVHMEQFKKMGSIANHPSSFRANSNKLEGHTTGKSLKRTNSKAELDKVDDNPQRANTGSGKHTSKIATPTSPVKRFKDRHDAKITSSPTASLHQAVSSAPDTPTRQTAAASRPPLLSTPTQSSLARSASVKSLKSASKIPSLARSSSVKVVVTPSSSNAVVAKTEGNYKYRNALSQGFSNVRSILRRPQIRFSDDPRKVAAGTHMATPKSATTGAIFKSGKEVPSVPQDVPDTPNHRREKHVGFSASTNFADEPMKVASPNTPSPVKKMPGEFPSVIAPISYPALPAVDQGTMSPLPLSVARSSLAGNLASPGNFTFKAGRTLSFSPQKASPTIRHVRQSDAGVIRGSRMDGPPPLSRVPHGIANKKRKHASVEIAADEDKENDSPSEEANRSKRVKTTGKSKAVEDAPEVKMPPSKRMGKVTGRGLMSLSRLNALAQPRKRA